MWQEIRAGERAQIHRAGIMPKLDRITNWSWRPGGPYRPPDDGRADRIGVELRPGRSEDVYRACSPQCGPSDV